MLRKASVLVLGIWICGCATVQPTPLVITATPLAETSTPHIIVVTATEESPQAAVTSEVTPVPTPPPGSRWQPIAIGAIEEAFREDGYSRYPLTDDEGVPGFFWSLQSHYERAITWEDGRIILQVLHDESPEVRAGQIEELFWRLDTVLPGGFMTQLRSEYDDYNRSVNATVSGEPERTYAYGDEWQEVEAEYYVQESAIGGYDVRFSLWWWQATCPPQYSYCYYSDFPGLEFTDDSSFVFHTIKLTPIEGEVVYALGEQSQSTPQEPTPANVGIGWEFNSGESSEGWRYAGHLLTPLHAGNGFLLVDASDDGGSTLSSPFFNVSALEFPIIEIRMKVLNPNTSQDRKGQILFITTNDSNFSYSKIKDFNLNGGMKLYTYTIDMSELGTWRGTIRQLRLTPIWGGDAEIEIDYIRFLSHAGGDTSLDDLAE